VTPRGVFLLYDCSSGEKVWESYVGVASSAGLGKVNLRAIPLLGAAYLLTGDFEGGLRRLEASSQ
jgi:hypothetical protein